MAGARLPVGVLSVVTVGFELGVDGADPVCLAQAAAKQQLHLWATQPLVRLGHASFKLRRHAERYLIGLLQLVFDLHGIPLCLELQGTGNLLLQGATGLRHDVIAQAVQRGGLYPCHGDATGEKKSQREQQQLGLERTLFHSTTPFGKNDNDMVGAGPDSCTVLDLLMGLCTASGYNFCLPER